MSRKRVQVNGVIVHDRKEYAPGMPVTLPKEDADRALARHGEWKGGDVEGDPKPVAQRPSRVKAADKGKGAAIPEGAVVISRADLDTAIADAAAAGAAAAIAALDEQVQDPDAMQDPAPDLLPPAGDEPAGGGTAA